MHDMKENERKMKMVVKGISRKIFRRLALESCPTVHLGGGPITVSEKLASNSPRRVVNIFTETRYDVFEKKKPFVLKTMFFSHLA